MMNGHQMLIFMSFVLILIGVTNNNLHKKKDYVEEINVIKLDNLAFDPLIHSHHPQPAQREFDSEYERIKHAMFIEDVPKFEQPEKEANSTLRDLSDVTTLEKPAFISFNQGSSSKAYSYVLRNLRKSSSHMILYPFKFTYTPETTAETPTPAPLTYEDGGVFTLKRELLPLSNSQAYFKYLKTTTNVQIGKAKAIYDGDIAILKLETTFEDTKMDLFYESDSYCNFFVNYIGKYDSCLLGKKEYLQQKVTSPTKAALVYYNHIEILANGLFDSDGSNLFSLLIVPDHVAGSENEIKRLFGDNGINLIKKFLNQGGNVLASGKSGYLFELWGVIAKGTYNTKYYLTSGAENSITNIKGCEGVLGNENTEASDFNKHLMCMNNKGKTYLVTSYVMNSANGMNVMLSIDRASANLNVKRTEDGTTDPLMNISDITEEQKNLLPFVLTQKVNKGKLTVINGNPLFKLDYPSIVYNAFFASMAKNVIFNTYIKFDRDEDLPIPGGEAGILIAGVVEFINLYNTPVKDFVLNVFIPHNVSFHTFDSDCILSTEKIEEIKDDTTMNHDKHLECKLSTLQKYSTFKKKFKLEILDHTVTQKINDIPLLFPFIIFTDSETNAKTVLNDGCLKVQAALGAILRGAINPDPSAFYPLPARGALADTVLQVENKENTIAKNVVYHGVIPLISPVLDGNDQSRTVKSVELYKKYYDDHNYSFPWKITGTTDSIDYQELSGKGITLVDEWDQPVKISKEVRDSRDPNFGETDEIEIGNYYGDDPNTNLKQIFLIDADLFFEHATQRAMPFVNTATPKGAAAYYQGTIPVEERDADFPDQAKKNILWSRHDIYFYPQKTFQMPTNVNQDHVISIDKYPKPTGECADVYGFGKPERMVEGYFDSTKDKGLKPDEYCNLMWKYCFHKQINGTDQAALTALSPDIKAMHYLVPVKDTDINRAGNIMGFTENPDKSGFFTQYPSLKFLWGHKIQLVVGPEESRQGGKLEIDLKNNTFKEEADPLEDGFITYSADQVAFYKTEWFPTEKKVVSYFKRGLMPNEAYGKDSKLFVHFENLNNPNAFETTIRLYEVKYDVTSQETNYETYELRRTNPVTIEKEKFFSLPAIEISTKMNRNGSSEIKEYELLAPYTRYGVYMQELVAHRTIWSSTESHHVSNPGLQLSGGGYALISNIGISSIPFVEYVTHGSGLLIPSAPRTSRLEWTDIWGRQWAQPLRSVFPDVPPIPPPLKNFMMSTTFEMLADNGKTRVFEWPSDEEVVVRVQMKFLNNFPKFFLPTTCPKNRYSFLPESPMNGKSRLFILPDDYPGLKNTDTADGDYQVAFGFSSVYGQCFKEEGSYLSGSKLTQSDFNIMDYAMICGGTNDAGKIKDCAEKLRQMNVKTLKKRVGEGTDTWNYSPTVEAYYPKNYIKPNMWDMTHYDYEDNSMDKAYKYHCDNGLPGLDVGPTQNPAFSKPHNLAAFPIFKGFGYQMEYDKSFTVPRFSPYKGWWSENLQNKDHTLLAGQTQSNDISVGKPSLIKDTDWVNQRKLKNTAKPNLITQRLKNIYVCMFNQHRIKTKPEQTIFSYPGNVHQNNIIPIIPDLDENDARYTNYDCKSDFYQYSPQNISQVDNIVLTPTDRDWLYFGVSLRGNAKENINILMKLKPFADRKFEGITKVQDGGRFVYWNPVNGPNSFLMVDNNGNTVEAYRTDLELTCQMYPSSLTTFKATFYHILSVSDPSEYHREYPLSTYMNSYGFGDSTVTVYVGGTSSTGLKIPKGGKSFVKVAFYNNCGFDWNMYGSAIDFEEKGEMGINANALLSGKVHMIKAPLAYHFLKLNIPDELKPYVTLTPSSHNIDVPGQFFDFESINVVTIRDGFEGIYSYEISISADFPDKLKGKLLEIPLDLLPEFFESLPGHNDPTNIHDYTLKVPPIKFGVPDEEDKLYYSSGRVTDLTLTYSVFKSIKVDEVRFLNEENLEEIRNALKNPETVDAALLDIWNNSLDPTPVPYSEVVLTDKSYNQIKVELSSFYPEFPKRTDDKFDITKVYVMSKAYAPQLEFGYQPILNGAAAHFVTKRKKTMRNLIEMPRARYANVKGAWIKVAYKYQVMQLNTETSKYEKTIDQRVFAADKGTLQVNVTAKNTGSDISYNTNFTLYLDFNVEVDEANLPKGMSYSETTTSAGLSFTLNTKQSIAVGETYTVIFYVKYSPLTKLRALGVSAPSRQIIQKVSAGIALKNNNGIQVIQEIATPLTIFYPSGGSSFRETVDLSITNEGDFYSPKFKVTAKASPSKTEGGEDVQYIFYRRNTLDTQSTWEIISTLSTQNEVSDTPLTENETLSLTQYNIDYRIETYNPNRGGMPIFLASSLVSYSSKLPTKDKEDEGVNGDGNGNVFTKESFPIWAIIVISIGGLILFGGGLFFFLFCYRKNKTKPIPREETPSERNVISLNKKPLSNADRKYSAVKYGGNKDNNVNPDYIQVSKFASLNSQDKSKLDKSDV